MAMNKFDFSKYNPDLPSWGQGGQQQYLVDKTNYLKQLQDLGLSESEANVLTDIQAAQGGYKAFAPAEAQIRSQLSSTRFGDIYDVEKNFGGLRELSDYFTTGSGSFNATTDPFTNTSSGGRTGGTVTIKPITLNKNITPRDNLNDQFLGGYGAGQIQNQQQAIDYTQPQFSNNNNQVYKEWNETTGNWDVFTTAGKKVSLEEFKNQGLNINHINTKNVLQGQIDSGGNINSGSSGSSGISGDSSKTTSNPYLDFNKFYTDTLTASGAGKFIDLYTNFKDQLDANDKELALKIADINDNPWLSEGLRSKKVENLKTAYKSISDSLIKSMDLYLGLYNSAKQDAQFQAQQATNMIHDQASLDQQLLLKQMDLAEKATDNARLDAQNAFKNQLDLEGLSIDRKKLALDQYKATLENNTDSTFSDVITASIDAGATPEQAAQEAAMKSELLGVPVSQKLLSQWKSQAIQYKAQKDSATTSAAASTTNSFFSPARAAGTKPKTGSQMTSGVTTSNIDAYKNLISSQKGVAGSMFNNLFGQ